MRSKVEVTWGDRWRKFWWGCSELVVVVIVAALFMGSIVLEVMASAREHDQWEKFRLAHACHVTTEVQGDYVTTVGTTAKGQTVVGTAYTGDKQGWTCDNGITYIRSK